MRWILAAAAVLTLSAYFARKTLNSQSSALPPELSDWPPSDSASPTDWTGLVPSWSWNDSSSSASPDEPDQSTDLLDTIIVSLNPSTYLPANVPADVAARNLRAFLDVIAWAEGADYNTLYGGGTFDNFADHPRQYLTFRIGGRDVTSSAAGRYQFLARTWDGLRDKLRLPDFSPASQDAGAVELIRERGALRDVQAGRFAAAVEKVRKVWASLPGAGYSQPEKSLSQLAQVFQHRGGIIEAQA